MCEQGSGVRNRTETDLVLSTIAHAQGGKNVGGVNRKRQKADTGGVRSSLVWKNPHADV